MKSITEVSPTKQTIITVAIATAAFLAALPIGAAVMSRDSVNAEDVKSGLGSCAVSAPAENGEKKAVSTHKVAPAVTKTHTDSQNSSNNSGSTAQVGHNGVATAVTVGDVLSNNLNGNTVSVPVLSNNTTNVSALNGNSLLSGNKLLNNSGVVDLGLLSL